MPPGSEYTAAGGGGKLKLKGSKTAEGRIDKKKKKSKSKPKESEEAQPRAANKSEVEEASVTREGESGDGLDERGNEDGEGEKTGTGTIQVGKTEAEKRYEEQRKKRVCFLPTTYFHSVFNTDSGSFKTGLSVKASRLTRNGWRS